MKGEKVEGRKVREGEGKRWAGRKEGRQEGEGRKEGRRVGEGREEDSKVAKEGGREGKGCLINPAERRAVPSSMCSNSVTLCCSCRIFRSFLASSASVALSIAFVMSSWFERSLSSSSAACSIAVISCNCSSLEAASSLAALASSRAVFRSVIGGSTSSDVDRNERHTATGVSRRDMARLFEGWWHRI